MHRKFLKMWWSIKMHINGEGYTVSNRICEENTTKEDEFPQLLNIKYYWNKDSDVLEVLNDNNLTVTFNLRKKIHSNYYSDDNKTLRWSDIISKRANYSWFQSKYSVFKDENNFIYDYSEEVTDLLSFIYIINIYHNSITAYV